MRNLFRFLGSLYYLSENGGDDRIMIDIRCAIVKGGIDVLPSILIQEDVPMKRITPFVTLF